MPSPSTITGVNVADPSRLAVGVVARCTTSVAAFTPPSRAGRDEGSDRASDRPPRNTLGRSVANGAVRAAGTGCEPATILPAPSGTTAAMEPETINPRDPPETVIGAGSRVVTVVTGESAIARAGQALDAGLAAGVVS